ncbi:MAG TPA: hypothetical protein VFW87_12375 [Pirellulales bacterium]|nr:hypothetical protein [Pirellulales bacterium]
MIDNPCEVIGTQLAEQKNASSTGYLRCGQSPNQRQQDGLKARFLPNAKRPMARHPIALPVNKFYSFGGVTGAKAMLPALMAEIQPVSRDTALQWLCALSKGILKDDAMTPPFQLHLARVVRAPTQSLAKTR